MRLLKFIRKLFFPYIHEELVISISRMQKYYLLKSQANNRMIKNLFSFFIYLNHKHIYRKYACDITPGCVLGNISFRHPLGIVIGGWAKISDGVIIHQGVTLGALSFDNVSRRGVDCSQIIGENTIICAGAKILGNVYVGKNCIIGANAIVTRDIPDNCTVVGFNKIIMNKI